MNSNQDPVIVAVDGPAGSGKSSICETVARKLRFTYVNTGAIYRAIGYLAARDSLKPDDVDGLRSVIASFVREGRWDPGTGQIFFRSELLNSKLYSEEAGLWASNIARLESVREDLLPVQRGWALAADTGALLDGRDIGTVVFPDARVKIFLTASLEQRAKRRQLQLQTSNPSDPLPDLDRLIAELRKRDLQDSQRKIAPLAQAKDAVVLDTSDLTVEQSIDKMQDIIKGRLK